MSEQRFRIPIEVKYTRKVAGELPLAPVASRALPWSPVGSRGLPLPPVASRRLPWPLGSRALHGKQWQAMEDNKVQCHAMAAMDGSRKMNRFANH